MYVVEVVVCWFYLIPNTPRLFVSVTISHQTTSFSVLPSYFLIDAETPFLLN